MTTPRLLRPVAVLAALAVAVWWPDPLSAAPLPTTTSATLQDAPPAVPAAPFQPVARVSSLMRGLGTALGELNGAVDRTDDDHRLGSIRAWSEVIGELSNVHTRHRREPAYLELAGATRDHALDLAREARASTPDEVRMRGLLTALDASCAACHEADF